MLQGLAKCYRSCVNASRFGIFCRSWVYGVYSTDAVYMLQGLGICYRGRVYAAEVGYMLHKLGIYAEQKQLLTVKTRTPLFKLTNNKSLNSCRACL